MHRLQKGNKTVSLFFMVFLAIIAMIRDAESQAPPAIKVEINTGNLSIQACNARLGDLLDEISGVCRVDIRGLDNRENEGITFVSGNGSIDCELQRLLRYLSIENYTFEYGDDQLRIISVYPRSDTKDTGVPPASDPRQEVGNRQSSVVRVEDIIEGSQADILNIMKGDRVISYDNTRILNSRQLINLVKSKPAWERIDMTIVRNGGPIRIVVNGGQIGIHIKDTAISSKEYEQ